MVSGHHRCRKCGVLVLTLNGVSEACDCKPAPPALTDEQHAILKVMRTAIARMRPGELASLDAALARLDHLEKERSR